MPIQKNSTHQLLDFAYNVGQIIMSDVKALNKSFTDVHAEHFLRGLCERGFIQEEEIKINRKPVYKISEKGLIFVRNFNSLEEFASRFTSPE